MHLSRGNLVIMIKHRIGNFNHCRDLMWGNVKNFSENNLLEHEKDQTLTSLKLMREEIESLEQYILEHKQKL